MRNKRLELFEKYADRMHKGFCEAYDISPEETGGIRCLLSNYINCYYGDCSLIPWDVLVNFSLEYYRKDRVFCASVTVNSLVKNNSELQQGIQYYIDNAKGYLLQPHIYEKEDGYCNVVFKYTKENIGMKQLKDTTYEVMSQFSSDDIDKFLDPIMKAIKKGEKEYAKDN